MEDNLNEIRQWLSSPEAYPYLTAGVELCETHISWVFLTDRHALKLKKPVKFDFLDFSTPDLRRHACEEELRLNRRLAPDVYLRVAPIFRTASGSWTWEGDGPAADWVVWMRRLDTNLAMDRMIREGRLTPSHRQQVADHLVTFYLSLPPATATARFYRDEIERHLRDNREALLSGLPEHNHLVRRIHTLQLRTLRLRAEEFDHRVESHRVVEGHGDLRPEHIYLESPPAIIDCIEFSKAFRTIDVADELSFLDMECQALGNSTIGEQLLATWRHRSGDELPAWLLAFYGSYRACVRAKVAMLRQQQLDQKVQATPRAAKKYLQLADELVRPLGPPLLIIVGGLSGSGKSTLARRLADDLDLELLATDTLRQQALGPSDSPASYGTGHYTPDQRAEIYQQLTTQTSAWLAQGMSVVADGTFLRRTQRRPMFELAHQWKAVPMFVECQCPRDVALTRIRLRAAHEKSASEARAEFYDLQAVEFEPPTPEEAHISVDSSLPIARQAAVVYSTLRRRLFDD